MLTFKAVYVNPVTTDAEIYELTLPGMPSVGMTITDSGGKGTYKVQSVQIVTAVRLIGSNSTLFTTQSSTGDAKYELSVALVDPG